ncbi:hypothetical protein [Sphingobium sp.]|uniref:hypothetical protein n=1 Tax=Sphingobium sp. TaxID=1912891 RepID=UPI003BB5DCC9
MATTFPADPAKGPHKLTLAGKIGAALFAFWGILHLWVGGEGLRLYFSSPAQDQWRMFIGGTEAPFSAFQFPVDPVTAHVHANLILNFCLDVAGYGLLGLLVAAMLYKRASWTAYFMALILIGLCDLSFTFLQVTSGTIALNLPTIAGPLLWLLAVIITPFGLPRLKSFRDVI